MRWEYVNGRERRRLSPEASAKLDKLSDTVWSAFDQAFVVARNDKPAPEPAPARSWPWRLLAWSSAFAWLAVLIWADRYAL